MSSLAEQNIIGSLLMDSECIDKICNILEPQMFENELMGAIYREYLKGYENRYEVNLVTLVEKLKSDLLPEDIITEFVKECVYQTTTSAMVVSYANVVLREYKRKLADGILSRVKLSSSEIDTQIGELLTELQALQDNRNVDSKSLSDITEEYKDDYFKENDIPKNYLGFDKLDDIIGGLEGGDVIVIGARPAVGKSALATQITSNLAKLGKRVGFYNLEMKNKQMYERFVVNESGLSLTRLKRAKAFLGDEEERFDKANEVLSKTENIIITTGSKSASEIRAESRHMNYDVIIIDYLQLLKADTSYKGNRYAEVGAISKAIKGLAMELNIPIILLSQLNRRSEGTDTKEPTMSELRESGDIEQDASVIVLLWNISEDKIRKGCKVEKNRQGNTGKIVMRFNGDTMRFEETDETIKEAGEWKNLEDECPFG